MNAQPGNSLGSLSAVTYSPWIAAKNHQLAVSFRARAIMARTPIAYQWRSWLSKVPPSFQALLRVKVPTVHLVDRLGGVLHHRRRSEITGDDSSERRNCSRR